MILLLLFTVAYVSASEQYVRLEDRTSGPGLPEHVTMDVVRDGRIVTKLNLQENKRLNENAIVYESIYDKGNLRQTKREPKPMTGFKYYQDKRNGAALSVTCEDTPSGNCKRSVEGYLDIGGETFEIRRAAATSEKRAAATSRKRAAATSGKHAAATSGKLMTNNQRDTIHLISRVTESKTLLERKRNIKRNYPHDYIELSKVTRTSDTSIRRQSETSKTEYAVEIIVVIDPYLWKRYLDKTDATDEMTKEQATEYRLRKKLAHVINGVSLRYESIEDPAFNVYVTISGFKFYKTDDDKSPVPKEGGAPVFIDGNPHVDAETFINNIMDWQFKLTGLQHDDHIMVFTGCELYSDGNVSDTSVAGMAPLAGACSYARVSIQEEGSYYQTTAVAAHELGHNLKADHDGDGESKDCKEDDKNIMAPWVIQLLAEEKYTENPWRFSECSIASFKSYFQSEEGKCLTDHGDYYDKTEWDKHNQKLPGELHTLDQQCKLINGDYSGVCSSGIPVTDERICRELRCIYKPKGQCSYHTPARGSTCGNPSEKKWCIDGKCVARVMEGTTAATATTNQSPTSKAPEQPGEDCFSTTAIGYKGNIKVTKTGKACTAWTGTAYQDASQFPDASVSDASNNCRSPDNDTHPWCFFTSEEWEYCDIQKCKPADYECFQRTADKYSGTRTVTKSGFPCLSWESNGFTDTSLFPDTSIADAANYCRDPDGTGQPWCYVENNSTYWEVCDIPKCV